MFHLCWGKKSSRKVFFFFFRIFYSIFVTSIFPFLFPKKNQNPQLHPLFRKVTEFSLTPGTEYGSIITIQGEGNCGPDETPGDVTILIIPPKSNLGLLILFFALCFFILSSPLKSLSLSLSFFSSFFLPGSYPEEWTRKGDDLYFQLGVPLVAALTGFSRRFRHVSGRFLGIESPCDCVLKPGVVKKVEGEGMPKRGGELFVHSFIYLFYFILFYFILFYFILFYFILFYFILFYFILFYFILFYFILFYFILFYFILFYLRITLFFIIALFIVIFGIT